MRVSGSDHMKFQSLLNTVLASLAVALTSFSVNAGVGEGQELYNAYCQICHGESGEGQTMGKPLTDGLANRLSDEDLLAVITEGRAGTGMAAWTGSFSDEEILERCIYPMINEGRRSTI